MTKGSNEDVTHISNFIGVNLLIVTKQENVRLLPQLF